MESDGRRGCRNKFRKICLVPDVASKITDVVKIGMEEKKSQFPAYLTFFPHVSIMVAPSELIMASLSTPFPFPFPPIIYPVSPTLTPPTGSGMGELPVVWCLRPVVGTSIPQRTQRSCSMTRRP